MRSDRAIVGGLMDAKPCPFCGQTVITVVDGDTFRWRHVECAACGATGPEIRCQTMGEGTPAEWELNAEADAIEAWNKRARASPSPISAAP